MNAKRSWGWHDEVGNSVTHGRILQAQTSRGLFLRTLAADEWVVLEWGCTKAMLALCKRDKLVCRCKK